MADHPLQRTFSPKRWVFLLIAAFVLALLALGLVWISNACTPCAWLPGSGFTDIRGWGAFFAALLLAAGLLLAGWYAIRQSEATDEGGAQLPRWLGGLLIGAALLRLSLGVLWFVALPSLGHGTPPEVSGYVMADAHDRDQTAFKLSQSEKPLWRSFLDYRKADQYGGLLFTSALVYRYLGTNVHQPLLMVVVAAAASALAVLFTWAFARRAWDDRVAKVAAWGIALYAEAVLLGSSQMREAFIIPLVAAAFYGLARLKHDATHEVAARKTWISLAWLLGGTLLTLPFSPPLTALLLATLLVTALVDRKALFHSQTRMPRWGWLLLGGLVVIVLVGMWLGLRQFAPQGMSNPIDVVSYWLRKSADLQAHFSKSASGWVQKIFHVTPEWTHIPILLIYGVLRPFLPAALVVSSQAPIWPWITLWRAIGWTILLILLVYALIRAWTKRGINHLNDPFTRALISMTWLAILIASLRGGGDQDDNPRYRAAFASVQVALAAWAWVDYRRSSDPLFRRALVGVIFVLAWFLPWYLRRQFQIPWLVVDPFKTIGLGIACAALFTIWDWARSKGQNDT
jgi:hypothetical protein